MNRTKLLSLKLFALLFVFASCADLAVENLNEPTKKAVEGNEENQAKLLAGGFYDLSTALVSSYGTHPDLIADQITSTNNVRNFWDFAQEPKMRLTNSQTYAGASAFASFYGGFNSSVSTANLFISNDNISDAIRAQAYFLRGLARGYLGMMYDQSYLIDETFEIGVDTPEYVPYGQLIAGAISDFETAISITNTVADADFVFNAMPNPDNSWDKNEFLDIVNFYAAKTLAGGARTATEAASIDWNKVKAFAEKGIGGPSAASSIGSFTNDNLGSAGEFASYYNDWANFLVSCGSSDLSSCSGYLPTDVKVIHTMDPSYPTTYPADSAQGTVAALDPATSNDPRLTGYYTYTTNAGFLRSTRNGNLYSNYFSMKLYSGNDWWKETNAVTLATNTENLLLLAEAHVMLGDMAAAAAVLNSSSAGTGETVIGFELDSEAQGRIADGSLSGGYVFDGSETLAEMQFALMREYAVEVSTLGGSGANWIFMRRHDLLQEGAITMFPVPAGELEILGLDLYQFGGVADAGKAGTASGANSWKDLAAKANLKVVPQDGFKSKAAQAQRPIYGDVKAAEANFNSKGAGSN